LPKASYDRLVWGFSVHRLISDKGRSIMPAYIVFTRTKTLDQKELEAYWAGIKDTMKGHPIEVLVAYGNHEVLEGDPIEGIVTAKFSTVKAAKTGITAKLTKASSKRRYLPRACR
jgi:uncharacterized protein (DUF1330 family)